MEYAEFVQIKGKGAKNDAVFELLFEIRDLLRTKKPKGEVKQVPEKPAEPEKIEKPQKALNQKRGKSAKKVLNGSRGRQSR